MSKKYTIIADCHGFEVEDIVLVDYSINRFGIVSAVRFGRKSQGAQAADFPNFEDAEGIAKKIGAWVHEKKA